MIREFSLPLKLPMILLGDFNEPPDDPVYREFIHAGSPLQDTWRQVHPAGQEATTQHGFDGRPWGSRIDWILTTPPFLVRRVAIIKDNRKGRYPSDHYPYEAEVEY